MATLSFATSENPAGPWKCIGYIDGIPSTIDPCLFVDDDGQAYVFTSGQGGCWMTKLKRDNWLEMEGESVTLLGPDGNVASGFPSFHEGPWVFKKDGRYYLVYADGYTTVNRMQYSVADNIAGPYTPKGVFMNPMGCNTTHGWLWSLGKWYTFYHTVDFDMVHCARYVTMSRHLMMREISICFAISVSRMAELSGHSTVLSR